MKKYLALFISLTLAFSFASCNKIETEVIEPDNDGSNSFELFANPVETKTINDGLATKWQLNDTISVFHAVAGTENFVNDGKFVCDDADKGHFTGVLNGELDEELDYDWYMIFPYNKNIVTPKSISSGYLNVGNTTEYQTDNDSKSHLCGKNFPLAGKVSNVDASLTPSVSMRNLTSVLAINVTNNSGAGLTVTSVSVETETDIVGTYFINFADINSIQYTASGDSYVYNVSTLKVNNGAELADGESAIFYIGVKPFSLDSGDKLTIKVNTFSKTKTVTDQVVFSAGSIKTINFNYNNSFTSDAFVLASSLAVGDEVIFVSGTKGDVKVMGTYASGNNIPAVDGKIIDEEYINSTSSMGIYIVGGNADSYTFQNKETDTYLNATSTTSSNYLRGIAELDKYSYWTLAFNDNEAVITNNGKTSHNIIRFNSNSNVYAAYSSGQQPVYIFKKGTPDTHTPVILSFEEDRVEKTTSNYNDFSGLIVSSNPSVEGIVFSIEGDNIGSVDESTGNVSLNGSVGTATITASFAGNDDYKSASASYIIVVTQATTPGQIITDVYSFTTKDWNATLNGGAANWTSNKAGAGYSNNGVQVTINTTGANATSPNELTNISKIVVTYNTNKSNGAGSISVKVGDNDAVSNNVAFTGDGPGYEAYFTTEFVFETPQTGKVNLTANTTTNSLYICSIAITYTTE